MWQAGGWVVRAATSERSSWGSWTRIVDGRHGAMDGRRANDVFRAVDGGISHFPCPVGSVALWWWYVARICLGVMFFKFYQPFDDPPVASRPPCTPCPTRQSWTFSRPRALPDFPEDIDLCVSVEREQPQAATGGRTGVGGPAGGGV